MNGLAPEQVILAILMKELGLTDKACWLMYQNRLIPNDSGLYIVVGHVDGQVIGAQAYQKDEPGDDPNQPILYYADDALALDLFADDALTLRYASGFTESVVFKETQRVQMRENIQIDILSRDNQALFRRWEVVGALRSLNSEQAQELYGFKIFSIPRTFVNASGAEGGSLLNRFTITVPCIVWYEKTTVIPPSSFDYYDDFKTRVDDEKTIGTDHGIIEFEIIGDEINGNPSGQ